MKKISFILRSFQVKVTLMFILAMVFMGVVSNAVIYKFAMASQFNQLQDKLKIIARTAALTVDTDVLLAVPLNREGVNTPQYKIIAEKLRKIKEQNQPIRFIYILTKTEEPGIWQFIVDPEPVQSKREGVTAYPGDKYNASRFPEMLKAFQGASSDKKLEIDEWGVTLSGYAPIFDKDNKAVAVLGVDMLASDVYLTQREVYMRAIFVLIAGIILSLAFGTLFSRTITEPIKRLVVGTRRISMGDLEYKVEVREKYEIRELADSFNKMACSLNESQKKNRSYFYDVIQSLVRIVEAKDHYTCGHSERVAEYAAKTASLLGFSQEQLEVLKETAMIHDIGKLGIQDNILNKKERLTEEEWEMIRRHPIIGEDILKPVTLNSEVLAIVRGHHERYDGKGYPDGLSGDKINFFAQILSVVDAYDAMVSSRAYRSAMSKEEAIKELKKNRATQFNPRVVDTFIKVLEEV